MWLRLTPWRAAHCLSGSAAAAHVFELERKKKKTKDINSPKFYLFGSRYCKAVCQIY